MNSKIGEILAYLVIGISVYTAVEAVKFLLDADARSLITQ